MSELRDRLRNIIEGDTDDMTLHNDLIAVLHDHKAITFDLTVNIRVIESGPKVKGMVDTLKEDRHQTSGPRRWKAMHLRKLVDIIGLDREVRIQTGYFDGQELK